MSHYKRSTLAGLTSAAVISAASWLLAAPHDGHDEGPTDKVFKVGKNGEVNIKGDVRIGESSLKNGKYLFEHQLEGEDHVFIFTEISKTKKGELSQPAVIRIKSKNALPGKTSSSIVWAKEEKDHKYRVLMIAVAGENIDHTF